ncbi:MAG: hypothetical protein ACMUIU_15475, partial [bacterium]
HGLHALHIREVGGYAQMLHTLQEGYVEGWAASDFSWIGLYVCVISGLCHFASPATAGQSNALHKRLQWSAAELQSVLMQFVMWQLQRKGLTNDNKMHSYQLATSLFVTLISSTDPYKAINFYYIADAT